MSLLAALINEGLDLYAGDCTDGSGGLDEVCQRENVARWLVQNHEEKLKEFYLPLLNKEIAVRQGIRNRATRPTSKAISAARDINRQLMPDQAAPIAMQIPLFEEFAKERYYVGPNLSKQGRDMTLREAVAASLNHLDLVQENQAKYDRIIAVVAEARRRGLGQDEKLKRLFI